MASTEGDCEPARRSSIMGAHSDDLPLSLQSWLGVHGRNTRITHRFAASGGPACGGPAVDSGGPGSGKTRVVTHRVAYLREQGIPDERIVALTFTNKAADEMRARLERLAPGCRSGWGPSTGSVPACCGSHASLGRAAREFLGVRCGRQPEAAARGAARRGHRADSRDAGAHCRRRSVGRRTS